MIVHNGVCVIVQARLGSTRLPKKALLALDSQNLLQHVLRSLQKVDAQVFILACDTASYSAFLPFANESNFITVAGSENDVLSRFALAIEKAKTVCVQQFLPDITCIVRATADNPFLFTEAINYSVQRYFEIGKPDYFTLTGLPHGSGVELMSPAALLKAQEISSDDYEREHVGPALYRHSEMFRIVYEAAPNPYYAPEVRTTVDTADDFERTQWALKYLEHNKITLPANAADIIAAANYASSVIICIPSVAEGNGTGHFRRCINIANALKEKVRIKIFLPQVLSPVMRELADTVDNELIIHELPMHAKLIVLDKFNATEPEVNKLKYIAPVLALDEGGSARNNADYLFDIIPTLNNYVMPANYTDPSFIPLPKNRKPPFKKVRRDQKLKVLVCCGGEDKTNLAIPVGLALSNFNFDVTVISPQASLSKIIDAKGKINLLPTLQNLREELFKYDIVFTIFGFTAFEALAAGCLVILLSPTDYHYQLACANGFSALPIGVPTAEDLSEVLSDIKIPSCVTHTTVQKDLADRIKHISHGRHFSCPICESAEHNDHIVVCRLPDRTISQCAKTGLHFLSFIISDEKEYNENYFFEQYKSQYGKTYLEDFAHIMREGERRLQIINELYKKFVSSAENNFDADKNILDIGCAYGAFLKACDKTDWFPVGTDISNEAIQYVKAQLKLPAFVSAFPALPESFQYERKNSLTDCIETATFDLTDKKFQAITMWFVIEHFKDLGACLQQVKKLLADGGIFAFSTPTLSGISGKQNMQKFFAESPSDHYSIFGFESVEKVLSDFGFKIVKVVSIGHHPERFNNFTRVKKGSFVYSVIKKISTVKKLGDSMEIYAVKRIDV